MRRILPLLFISLFTSGLLSAQTVFFTEDFTTAGAGWNFNVILGAEDSNPNFWKSSAEEGGNIPPNLGAPGSCGIANNGNNSLFITSALNPTGGAAYDAGVLCGFGACTTTDRRTESPVINCTGKNNISLNFEYIEGGDGTNDDATLWYNDGTGFVLLDNMPKTLTGCGGQGLWVTRTLVLPASANNNTSVQIAFRWVNNGDNIGTDPSFAVDNITLSVTSTTPTLAISPSPNDTICQSATLTLNGSVTGGGPIVSWAWTVSPTPGVVFAPDTFSQNPTVTFTTPGTYTFTLAGTNADPSTGTTTQTITVLPTLAPSVTITASPINPVCAGIAINFTATPTNGGTAPVFQWQINGSNAGSNSPNFSSSTLSNNDIVTLTVTSNAACVTPATAADSYTVLITPSVVPSVTITADDSSICAGTTVNFTASPTNGGAIPSYQWQINSSNVGTDSPNFSSSTLNNNDVVTVILTSNAVCPVPATATSATITITVTPTVVPVVVLTPDVANPVCVGNSVTFTATPTNGGLTPSYQWLVNGAPVGANSPTFGPTVFVNGDVVSVTMTSNAACATPATATVDYTVQVVAPVAPSVTITADDSSICAGTIVNFTATPTNGGTTPAYQWQINGANAGSNSANFSTSTLNNNDVVTVILTSNAPCATPTTATSGTITITVTPTVVPSVVLTEDVANPFCQGTTVTFTATPTNGGTSPSYQWQINASTVGINSPNFSSSSFANGDVVSVTMTSSAVCATPSTTIQSYTVVVTNTVVPTVTVNPDPVSACAGSSITFTATSTNGGTTPVFQWILNGSNSGSNSSTFTLSNIVGGESISVILTSNAACAIPATANSNTVIVTALPQPTLAVTQSTATVCPGQPDTLVATATPGSTFSWTPSAGLNTTANDSVIATNLISGIYTYYVTATLAGCTRTDSVKATVSNGLVAVAGPPSTICSGQSAPLSVTGGTDWLWIPLTGNIACDTCQNTTATPTVTTTYSVIASIGACTDTVTETITVIPNASVSFNTSSTSGIPQTVTFTNTSSNAVGYFWTFGDNLSSVLQTPAPHTYNAAGTYTVVLIAYGQNGCNDTLPTQLIIVDTVGITVPNIFTPNGDQINDVWQPNVHGSKTFECVIFDRWGLKVYEFAGDQDHWDGHTTAGLACTDGTYYYILKATDLNNKAYNLKGFIQLIH